MPRPQVPACFGFTIVAIQNKKIVYGCIYRYIYIKFATSRRNNLPTPIYPPQFTYPYLPHPHLPTPIYLPIFTPPPFTHPNFPTRIDPPPFTTAQFTHPPIYPLPHLPTSLSQISRHRSCAPLAVQVELYTSPVRKASNSGDQSESVTRKRAHWQSPFSGSEGRVSGWGREREGERRSVRRRKRGAMVGDGARSVRGGGRKLEIFLKNLLYQLKIGKNMSTSNRKNIHVA